MVGLRIGRPAQKVLPVDWIGLQGVGRVDEAGASVTEQSGSLRGIEIFNCAGVLTEDALFQRGSSGQSLDCIKFSPLPDFHPQGLSLP
ncbi:MAG: hypothetical protein FVQ83_15490 [Chloroflexi bacterium]|nr:hypothetical protein [Chloroflexota bacterium]